MQILRVRRASFLKNETNHSFSGYTEKFENLTSMTKPKQNSVQPLSDDTIEMDKIHSLIQQRETGNIVFVVF